MASGANVMDFRIENLKSTTLGGTRLTRRWIADLQKTVARFPALSRHELASTLCSHLGWFTPKGRDRLGSCRSPAAVLAPEDAWVRLWQHRRCVLNTLVVSCCSCSGWGSGRGVRAMRPRWPNGGRNAADGAGWRRARDEEPAQARRGPVGASDGERGPSSARMEVDCSGGELSCNGGAALLLMLAEQVQLFERASGCFTDHRDPSKVAHPLVALLGQRILGLARGYEDVNDHDELRRDRALSTAMGRVECARSDCEPLAGKSTLNRMELSANGARHRSGWLLDIDATDVELHGRQEHRFYHGYYHAYGYLPRLVFCNGWPVRTELRTSSGDVAAGVVETIAPLVDRLRKRCPQVPILIRADGAYCRDEWMTWCEARGVDYVLGLPRNDRLKDRVQPLMDDLRDRLKRDPDYAQQAVRGYRSFGYRTRDSWRSRERCVIAKAEWLPGPPVGNADGEPAGKADGGPEAVAEGPCAAIGEARYNSRFVVTSLQKPDDAQTVYEAMYCDRGAAENWIKEQKNDLFLDRCPPAASGTSTHSGSG